MPRAPRSTRARTRSTASSWPTTCSKRPEKPAEPSHLPAWSPGPALDRIALVAAGERPRPGPRSDKHEELALPGDALQVMSASLLELEAGSVDELADRRRDPD